MRIIRDFAERPNKKNRKIEDIAHHSISPFFIAYQYT